MKLPLKVCLVNGNYPPVRGATGWHAEKLLTYLSSKAEFTTHIVSIGKDDDESGSSFIKGVYKGKNKFFRLFSSLWESYRLIQTALQTNADVYIIMTDPPFLNFWSGKHLKNDCWVYWAMDLYPDAFAANDLVSTKNLFYRLYQKRLRRYPPNLILALGALQLDLLRKNYYPNVDGLTIPIGLIQPSSGIDAEAPMWADPNKIIFGYVGNLGEAHDHELVINLAKQLNPKIHQLVLCCKGSKANNTLTRLRALKAVLIKKSLTPGEMSFIDIQIVSLLPGWSHLCVPSKAISAIDYGSAVLFCGNKTSDTWQYIEKASWRIDENNSVQNFLSDLTLTSLSIKRNAANDIAQQLHRDLLLCYEAIAKKLRTIQI